MNQRIGLTAVDFATNPPDIDIDDIGRWIKVQIPYMLQEHGSRDHLTDIASKILQQFKLTRQQFDFLTSPPGDPLQQIDLQVADPQYRLLDDGATAAGERVDTRHHLLRGERLYQIVVAARAQTADAIIDFAESAEDQRRRGDPLLSQPTNDFDSID